MSARVHLATLLDDMRRLGPETALVEHRGVRRFRTTYAALALGADWFAAELIRRNITPGERVILWGQNSAAWIACFFGCVKRAVLVVPLDATGTLAFAERIIRETSPRLIIGDPLLLRSLDQATPQISMAMLEDAMRQDPPATARSVVPVAQGLGPDTPLQILFTSGTTGEPKGVVHTHRNLLASLTPIEHEIERYRRYERLVHPLHFLHTLPLSHVFGQFMGLWVAPVLGATVHYESRLEASGLLRLLPQERISVLAAVPRVLDLLRTALLAAHPSLSGEIEAAQGASIWQRWWRFRRVHTRLGYRFWAIVCGGATLPPALETFWTTLGTALIQGYGMTETAALVTLNHPFKPARGTLGAPLPGRELRISAEGELLVRGEMVSTTTWQHGALHAATAGAAQPALADGSWLATGDLTRRDEQGRLHYLGRTGQRLVTQAGLNVYLQDVEAALAAQPGVDAAVALTTESQQGPQPGAVLRAASLERAAQAVSSANRALAPHQRIARWWLWPELDFPRTATGKVRRHLVEAWVQRLPQEAAKRDQASLILPCQAGTIGGLHLPESRRLDPLVQLLQRVCGITVEQPAPQPQQSLESLGLDSLGRVQLQAALEQASGRSIDDAGMAAAQTLDDLRRLAGLALGPESEPGDSAAPAYGQAETLPGDAIPGAASKPQTWPADLPPDSAPSQDKTFLYLRWPWASWCQLLRGVFLETCMRPLVWLLAAPRLSYAEPSYPGDDETGRPLDTSRPVLIVANHVSSFDVPLLLSSLPAFLRRHIAIAAAGEMLEDWRHARSHPLGPVIFWLLTVLFNVFPLPRGAAFQRAFLHAGEALDRGYSVLIFPEGARSHGGDFQPFRGGIGLLAHAASVQVLPMALAQWRRTGKPGIRGWRPYGAGVCIGQLITIEAGADARLTTLRLEAAVRQLLETIKQA